MGTANGSTGFQESFEKIAPLIRDEWPVVAADALAATGGDYERVVALIADKTEHTKTLVKRQLAELRDISDKGASSNGGSTAKAVDAKLHEVLHKLQERSNEIAGYVKKQLIADAKAKVSENPLVTVLMAIGLGILLGFILRGGSRRD
jgi:ElaB/YqjD/DUF883 family membrane-anchored ribosome-binding protein